MRDFEVVSASIDPNWEALWLDVEDAFACASTREQVAMGLYYGLIGGGPMSLREVGRIMGLDAERVRQVIERGLRICRMAFCALEEHSPYYRMCFEGRKWGDHNFIIYRHPMLVRASAEWDALLASRRT